MVNDDSDDGYNPWLNNPIVTTPPRLPMNYYPQEPPVWATYGEGLAAAQRAAAVAANNTPQVEVASNTAQVEMARNTPQVEVASNTLPVEQEIVYLNM